MEILRKFLQHLSAALFCFILIILAAAVFWRYVLNDSIIWAEELIRIAFIWMFFLAMPEVSRSGTHLALDLLPTSLRGGPKKALCLFIEAVNLSFLAILLYYSIKMAAINMTQKTPALLIPYGFLYLAISIGCVLMILATCQRIYQVATDTVPGKPAEEVME